MGKVTKSKKPDDNSNIGDRIRYIRTKQGISQDELGGRIFKSRGEINYYENNSRLPDVQTLINIANSLEVSMDYLCGINGVEKPNIEFQAINKMIGLNEDSIYKLSKFANSEEILKDVYEDYEIAGVENGKLKLAMVNKLLSNNVFEEILQLMVDYEDIVNKIKNQPTDMTFQRNNLQLLEEKKETIEYRITKKIVSILNNENGC